MICLVCRQSELLRGFASVTLERAETKLTITSVPALICPSCGDACVDEGVAVRLLRSGEQAVETGRHANLEFAEIAENDG